MATLNTLRTRGALFLSIVIGVALIAFLLGDLTSASSVFQSRRNRVGTIAGNHIDYMDFANASQNLEGVVQMIYNRTSLSAEEVDQVRDMAWDRYIRRFSFNPGYQKLGLGVGDNEEIDMVKGEYVSPVIASIFGSPATGMVDPAMLAEFIAQLDNDTSGRMPALWEYAKSEMADERMLSKYVSLVRGGSFVNDLEVAHGVAAANNAYTGSYATVPFSSIADSLVDVTSSDVRAYYRRHKDNYRRTASREIEYVTFEVAPSEADFAAAAEHMATVAEEFAAAEDPMQYAQLNSQERADATYYTADRLSGDEYAIAFGDRRDQMAGPTLAGNVYTVSRVADRRTLPDSVGARHILLPAGSTSADSLVRAIRGGADIFALAPLYSIDGMVDLGRFPPEMMVEPFADAVIAARATDVFSVETQFGIHVVQMTYKGATVTKARVATVTYTVEPSAATEQAAYNEAREFLTAAAGSREKFDAAVTSTGVNRRVATIGQNDRNVSGLPNSRGIVSWSFNAKPGTVSTIMEVDGDYVVAVLTDAKEAGVADVREVAQTIAQQLRTDEKAVMLAKQMAGKSVAEVAAMEGATTGDITALRPNAFFNPALGMEPAVMGAFEAMKAGDTSKPIESFGGVYVISVSAVEALEEATDASERVRLEAASDGTVAQRLMQALADGSDIKDYRVKFF